MNAGRRRGGILWAGGTTFAIYYLGRVAEEWLKGFSWVGLVVALLFGLGTTLWLKRRAARAAAEQAPAEENARRPGGEYQGVQVVLAPGAGQAACPDARADGASAVRRLAEPPDAVSRIRR